MGELMDGQPLFPGDSEVDQLFVIQKVLGPLPDFLQEEFNRNSRFQGLKFPEISHPETIEARYAAVMNDIEIELMQKMLEMDPYQRIKAREAIEHEYFDDLRNKDPEYNRQTSQSSIDAQLVEQDSQGQFLGAGGKRILSPELINNRSRAPATTNGTANQNLNLSNKNSYSHASHHNVVEATRRSDNAYNKNNAISNSGGTS
jgi:serine/threonine protein kinase